MIEDQLEVKVIKIVKEPRISLTMISRYVVATEKRKTSIIKGCKYPPNYIPTYHEMARKLICELFEGNFIDQHHLYFEEFKRQATIFRKDAREYPENRNAHKNRIHSAKGLEGIIAMSHLLMPILEKYILNSNLHQRRNYIMKNGVRIGSVADMLVSDQINNQIGFLKFNFSVTKKPKEEAATKLFVLKKFFENKGVELNPKSCIIVDVPTRRVYTMADAGNAELSLDQATVEIRDSWDLI